MTNSEKYNFSDFTLSHYKELLKLVAENYVVTDYHSFKGKEAFIIWRHDVDLSLYYALKLAKLESEAGISSTYFLHLHGEFYNLMDGGSREIVKEILSLGHQIGVHYDANYYEDQSIADIERGLEFEKTVFTQLFGSTPAVFSFHNTSPFVLSCKADSYAGMVNTYGSAFQDEIGYCSDSNGYWRHDRLYDVLKSRKHKKLQALTHPEWWQEVIRSPKERVMEVIRQKAVVTNDRFEDSLRTNGGRENIDWE